MRDNIRLIPNYKPSVEAMRKLCVALHNTTPCTPSFTKYLSKYIKDYK